MSRLPDCEGDAVLSSCRLSLGGGRPHVVVDGGAPPRRAVLRALLRVTDRVAVLQLPQGRRGLDWLVPVADHVGRLSIADTGADLDALEAFPCLRELHLTYRPGPGGLPLHRQAPTLHSYDGPWFPALDPVLAGPRLRALRLEQPPRDVGARLTAPLDELRLHSARKLPAVPVLACTDTLTSLEVAGGRALDLTGLAAYPRLASLSVHGRTPLRGFAELAACTALRHLFLEGCHAVDDVEALRRLTLEELRIVGRPETLDPQLLRTARDLGVRRFSAPEASAET